MVCESLPGREPISPLLNHERAHRAPTDDTARAPKYMRYAEFALRANREPNAGGGQQTLLLCEPLAPPPRYVPYVHALRGEPKELAKRALEATRIAPMLPPASWKYLLGPRPEDSSDSHAPALIEAKLNAVCQMASSARLAVAR